MTKRELFVSLKNAGFQQMSKPSKWFVPGTYICHHGEYDRPTYHVRKYKDGYGVHVEYFYYPGTFHAPKDHRLSDDDLYWLLHRHG